MMSISIDVAAKISSVLLSKQIQIKSEKPHSYKEEKVSIFYQFDTFEFQ